MLNSKNDDRVKSMCFKKKIHIFLYVSLFSLTSNRLQLIPNISQALFNVRDWGGGYTLWGFLVTLRSNPGFSCTRAAQSDISREAVTIINRIVWTTTVWTAFFVLFLGLCMCISVYPFYFLKNGTKPSLVPFGPSSHPILPKTLLINSEIGEGSRKVQCWTFPLLPTLPNGCQNTVGTHQRDPFKSFSYIYLPVSPQSQKSFCWSPMHWIHLIYRIVHTVMHTSHRRGNKDSWSGRASALLLQADHRGNLISTCKYWILADRKKSSFH